MKGCGRLAAMTAAFFVCATGVARADGIEATAAISINALDGQHEVARGERSRLSFAPLPLAEVTLRYGAQSVRLEGLPPLGLGFGGLDGTTLTSLSILNATYRVAAPSGWFAGAGETVYNQRTTYPSRPGDYYARGNLFVPIDGGPEVQYSRVTGFRIEAGRNAQLGPNRLEFDAALNPRMHGVAYTAIPTMVRTCSALIVSGPICTDAVRTMIFADPENASQVDLLARVARRVSKHGELLLGLRYLNYGAHYDQFPGQIADRNSGFAPSLGYRVRL